MENKELTFEAALARLEEIVNALEDGSAPLSDSLTLFEEGVSLVRSCGAQLDAAERKIRILTKNEDGTYDEQDFKGDTSEC